ncbi:MAG: hypothetical protein LIP23_06455, partial [Planctomycetes bacterium]|nr:hypothetical protein [Planctomycetota bacterium]
QLIPISDAARQAAQLDGKTPLQHALADGEDFELLVAMPPRLWHDLEKHNAGLTWRDVYGGLAAFSRIGEITEKTDIMLRAADGTLARIEPEGYIHTW